MKKTKKCYRTMSGDNFDPTNCTEEQCSAWMKTDKISGCSFVLNAIMFTIKTMTDMIEQEKKKNAEHNNREGQSQGGEGRPDGTEKDRKQDDTGSAVQEDTKEATEGEDQGYVGKGEDIVAEPNDQGVSGDTLDFSSCASVTANPILKEPK